MVLLVYIQNLSKYLLSGILVMEFVVNKVEGIDIKDACQF